MRILCTHNGRHGDLLWALPTIRAISRRIGHPVDLVVPDEFRTICPLLCQQPYLEAVWAHPGWIVHPDHREAPVSQGIGYDQVIHLGYRGWPLPNVVAHTLDTANLMTRPGWLASDLTAAELDLTTPWITAPTLTPQDFRASVTFGWTDCHFELKYGLMILLGQKPRPWTGPELLVGTSARWVQEAGHGPMSWEDTTKYIAGSRLFVGDCSALHVLAVACGVPVVCVEPMEARWNPVFYPLGTEGPQVWVVKGNDGQPTFDARHVREQIQMRFAEVVDAHG